MENRLLLRRFSEDGNGTIGILSGFGREWFTLEPPFRDNRSNISSIPEGDYKAAPHVSPKFGNCLKINDVPNRTNILIHAGNYIEDTRGCILTGCGANIEKDHKTIVSSRKALQELLDKINKEVSIEIRSLV